MHADEHKFNTKVAPKRPLLLVKLQASHFVITLSRFAIHAFSNQQLNLVCCVRIPIFITNLLHPGAYLQDFTDSPSRKTL